MRSHLVDGGFKLTVARNEYNNNTNLNVAFDGDMVLKSHPVTIEEVMQVGNVQLYYNSITFKYKIQKIPVSVEQGRS